MKFISCILFFVSLLGFAHAEEKELPPLDPEYVGVHGMVLVSHSSKIYASHLPLYHKPHDVQLLYKIETKDVALVQLVRDAQLVTIKPEEFNLQRLMRGEKMTLTADVYIGHFERDGIVTYEKMPLIFDELLYVRKLDDLQESNRLHKYDVVSINKNDKIYVHQIQQAPSYDQLLFIDQTAGCLQTINTSSGVPSQDETLRRFLNCGTLKPLYYETQDFAK
ncbi:hypothetical protein [Thalassotalea fusca]